MSEIISLHIGTFGANVAHEFWKQIAQQQIIGQNCQFLQNHDGRMLFFQQRKNSGFRARSIFCDMESRAIERVVRNDIYGLHDTKDTILINKQSRGLFLVGKYCQDNQKIQEILQGIRRQVERCDRLSGFMITNAVQGGTGSGLYALVLTQLNQRYGSSIVQAHTLFPQLNESNSPLHIYNAVFSIYYTQQKTNFQILLDNSSAINMLRKQCNVTNSFAQINKIFGRSIAQQTSSYRFPGVLNSSQRKVATNMILFPRMKFFYQSISEPNIGIRKSSLASALQNHNCLFGQGYQKSKNFYAMSIHSRDPLACEQQTNRLAGSIMSEKGIKPTQWIANSYHISYSNNVNEKCGRSTSVLSNSASTLYPFQRAGQMFTRMFRRKAFAHHYLNSGMDQMEFIEAESNLNDLVSEYRPFSGCYEDSEQQIQS